MRNLQVNIGLNANAFTKGAQQVAAGFNLIGNAGAKVSGGVNAATISIQKNSQAMLKAKVDAKGLTESYRELRASRERITQMGRGLTLGLSAPLLLAGGAALKTAVDMEALKVSLAAVTGSTAEAEAQFKRLIQVAKAPGITLKGAVETSITLQSIGYDAAFSEKAIKSLGNAMALMGKSEDDLKGVVLALSQIKGKGKAEYEEINQIAERLPQIRDIIKKTWGLNSDQLTKAKIPVDEFIEGIVTGIAAMPKFAGSAKNDLMNLKDVIQQLGDAVGKGLLPPLRAGLGILIPVLEKVGGVLNSLPPSVKNVGLALTGIGIIIGPLVMLMGSFSSGLAAARQGLHELATLKARFATAAGTATTATAANTAATATNTGATATNTGATGANAAAKNVQAAAIGRATGAMGIAGVSGAAANLAALNAMPGGSSYIPGNSSASGPGSTAMGPFRPPINAAASKGGGFLSAALAALGLGALGNKGGPSGPGGGFKAKAGNWLKGFGPALKGFGAKLPGNAASLAPFALDMYANSLKNPEGQPDRQEDTDVYAMKMAAGIGSYAAIGALLGSVAPGPGNLIGAAAGGLIGGAVTHFGLTGDMEKKYKAQADAANEHATAIKQQTAYLERVQEISQARIAGMNFEDDVMKLEAKHVDDKVKLSKALVPVYESHVLNLRNYISKIEKHKGPTDTEKREQIAEVESEISKKELEIAKIKHGAHKRMQERLAKIERDKEKAWAAQLGLIETVAEAQTELAPKGFEKRAAAQILVPALMKQQGIINKKLQETKRGSEDFFLLQNDFFKIQTHILQIRKGAVEEANKKNTKTREEMQELVQASHNAAEARIKSEIEGSPEHLKETATAAKMIPFLMQKKEIMLNMLKQYNRTQKEFWSISKDVWDVQSSIVQLSQSSVTEANKNEKERLEKLKKENSESMELFSLKGQRLDEQMRGAGLTEEQQAVHKIPYMMQLFKKLSAPVSGETAIEKEQREISALKTRNDITQSLFQRNKPQGKVAFGGGIIPMFKPESAFPGQGYSGMFKPDVYVFQNQFNIANDAEFEKRVVDVLSRMRQMSGNFRRRN